MRDFSSGEIRIIRDRLINGCPLRDMFSTSFTNDAKLVIAINENGSHLFKFCSDNYSSDSALEEIVNTVNLLSFLQSEGLIYKYPPSATVLTDFDKIKTITIGNSTSTHEMPFLLMQDANYLVDFLCDNWEYRFVASEPLKSLSSHNFKSAEDRRLDQNTFLTRIGLFIALGTSVISTVVTCHQNSKSFDDLNSKMDATLERVKLLNDRIHSDSVNIHALNEIGTTLGKKIDSLEAKTKSIKSRK